MDVKVYRQSSHAGVGLAVRVRPSDRSPRCFDKKQFLAVFMPFLHIVCCNFFVFCVAIPTIMSDRCNANTPTVPPASGHPAPLSNSH